MNTVAERLADTLLKLKFEEIPSEVIAKAKLCVLDTLGVALAGSKTSVGKIARNFGVSMEGRKEATIFNYGDRVSCLSAAYANGTMAFCHNFTDTTLSCVVHCGPVIIPTALSVAEKMGSTGKEFLVAVVAGYEMMSRVGNAINSGSARMNHHKSGFHATATTGVFGTCLTASMLLGLSPEQAASALGTAGSYASGILGASNTSPDSETWKTHAGIAGQNGISAAILAQMGLKGPVTILEGKKDFLYAFGWGKYDLGKFDEDLGKRFLIMDSAFKLYNCAHVWANPLDCLKRLMETHHFKPDEVAEIKVIIPTMYTFVMASRERVYPRNYAEAENNPYYLFAAMMLHGRVSLDQFQEWVLNDSRMKEMAGRVAVEVDPSLDAIFTETDKAPAIVKVILKQNGKELSATADYPRGSPKNPTTPEETENKFVELAGRLLKEDKAWEIIRMVRELERQDNLNDLMGLLIA
jgi:2-methylcitrate dehydratase PrpD